MKKPHYFYKVSATSDVGREIQNYMNRCQDAEQQALEWAKRHGAEHPMSGTDLEKEMNALPVVSEAELISIFSLQPKRTKNNLPLPMTFGDSTPVVFLHQGFWYADVPYVSADMTLTQIEEKEFYRRRMAAINEQK